MTSWEATRERTEGWMSRLPRCGRSGTALQPLRRAAGRALPSQAAAQPARRLARDRPRCADDLARHVSDAGVSQQIRLLEFVAACENSGGCHMREQLRKALKKRPHLIYWLGHADPSHLAFGDDRVSQADLGNFLRDSSDEGPATSGGLVFLNACQTARSPDKGLGSFLKAFHDADFSGIIATEERTLDNVASPFGLDVMDGIPRSARADRRDPAAAPLSNAPLGLLYGTYCPPDVQIRTDTAPGARDPIGQVGLITRARGVSADAAASLLPLHLRRQPPERQAGRAAPSRPAVPAAGRYGTEHRALFAGRDDDITGSPVSSAGPRLASLCSTARAVSASRRS